MDHFTVAKDMLKMIEGMTDEDERAQNDQEAEHLLAEIALYDERIAELDAREKKIDEDYEKCAAHIKKVTEW